MPTASPDTVPLQGVTPALATLGVIRAEGPDAASFLHGQLTQDFMLLRPDQARLAALCNPKGRMLASFIGIRPAQEQVLLVCSRDLLAPTLRRLSMYVLRAKVKLTDASGELAVHGLAGGAIAAAGADPQAAPWQCHAAGAAFVIHLYPADGAPRALWLAPEGTPAPQTPVLDAALWAWSEARSGVATLSAPVAEAFVPQMLNYESVGGVNFKKGCYPGQEVVARSQFRGTLKRRTYRVEADAPLAAGQEVFADADPQQPVGTVVQAAAGPGGGWSALVSMQTSAQEAGTLHAQSPQGPPLRLAPLPYPLLDDL
ncbi:MAG: folate-binding protein [Xenophilus sp.]